MTLEEIAREHPHRRFVLNHGTPVSRDSPPIRAFHENGELIVEMFDGSEWQRIDDVVQEMIQGHVDRSYMRWLTDT